MAASARTFFSIGKRNDLVVHDTSCFLEASFFHCCFRLAAISTQAPFSSGNFWLLATVALSFVFDKNYPIMDYLGLKDSSHDFSVNCVIFFSSTFSTPCMCRKIRCDGES